MWKKSGRIGSNSGILAGNWAIRAEFREADWREFAHLPRGAVADCIQAMRFCAS
jgi:hypothetical protein